MNVNVQKLTDAFRVESRSRPGLWHVIGRRAEDRKIVCTCESFEHRDRCKHVSALQRLIDEEEEEEL